jgi:hypothetical protein
LSTRITLSALGYCMADETRVGEFDALITDVEGNAYLTGYHQFDEKEYRSLSTGEIARVDATGNPATLRTDSDQITGNEHGCFYSRSSSLC